MVNIIAINVNVKDFKTRINVFVVIRIKLIKKENVMYVNAGDFSVIMTLNDLYFTL